MAAHLCLPSPAGLPGPGPAGQAHRVQGQAGGCHLCGHLRRPGDVCHPLHCHNTWRVSHNDIMATSHAARVEVEAEPFGLFRDIIPATAMGAGGKLETVRGRSGCVPDLHLGFPISLCARPANYHPPRGPWPVPARQARAYPPDRPALPAAPYPGAKQEVPS